MTPSGSLCLGRIPERAADVHWDVDWNMDDNGDTADSIGEHAALAGRLHDFGQRPLDADTRRLVLDRIHAPRRPWWRSVKLRVAAAAGAGFLAGSVGLASAGSLPGPAQQAAHSVLGTVGINVPPGQDRYNDPVACPGGPYRNHGAYVRAHPNDPNAAASNCGKPMKSVNKGNGGTKTPEAPEAPDTGDDQGQGQGQGPPSWAHGHKGAKGNNGNGNKGDKGDDGNETTPTAPNGATPNQPAAPSIVAPTTTAPTTTAPTTTTTTAPPTTTTSSTTTSTSTTTTAPSTTSTTGSTPTSATATATAP